ncbi:DUF72 domain-containing protein [Salinimicrobium oceani]|uniref:DUF72 domain-containing protein n=1 Tax=Salinimicrobium oceani TaxID=2722702 RepID=A0ABX1CZC7_9FLAO|nr:DUF72 domain-containing protein [Salinimicrobium oceani]NJW51671.1 DUF72 domain-containing protein [Salinimicrobium oceani]
MKVHIGCSGYNYKEWRGPFYPQKLAQRKWLEHYSSIFDTVEINNTFYRFPREKGLLNWRETVSDNFQFTLKGHRYVTHRKKLKDADQSVKDFELLAKLLKTNLGCILWQLPPNLHRNDEKLENFCKTLDREFKNVLEFRHESWYDKEVYDLLENYGIIFSSISSPEFPDDLITTDKTGYLRFHGTGKDWYDHLYTKAELKEWHKKIMDSGLEEIYIYFNNDIHAHAPRNAQELMELFE